MMAREISRRAFLELASATTAGAILASCAPGAASTPTKSSSNNKVGGITVIPYFTTEDDPHTVAVVDAAAAAFAKANPSVRIAQIVIGANDRDQRVLTGLTVGQDLGIFEIGTNYKDAFVSGGYLYPMDSLVQSIGADQFVPGTRVVENGHDYVFPYGGSPIMLWYRKDRVPNAPKTLDDVVAAAAANTGGGNYGIALGLGGQLAFQLQWLPFLYNNGGDYVDTKGNVVFGSDRVTQAINDWLKVNKYAPPGNSTWAVGMDATAYISQRTAMTLYVGRLGVNVASQAPHLADMTSVAVPSLGSGSPVGQEFRWSYFGIDKNTANPEMALEFLKTLFTGSSGVDFANTVPGSLFPSVKSTRDAFLAQTNNAYIQQHGDWLRTLATALPLGYDISGPMGALGTGTLNLYNGPPAPWAPQIGGVNPIDMQMMQKIVLEGMSVSQAQSQAVDQMKGIISDYKRKHPSWRPQGA